MKLTETQIEQSLSAYEGWKREDGRWITKKYRFHAFMNAITFVDRVADASEQLDHHPFIAIDFKIVTLRLTTWHEGGITALDFQAAEAFDKAFALE
ncbi:4a-hydroxytetrahydrobiopterin dehydratase [Paenibacillus sinopodophylli]|uniref:4a-hydroxytetrahydrobiopterin dehydratase n=1 Tax=Paenibacillus sinopodophylli TaxID=1837342 RepID=UPI00110CC3FA|nr:4a-hydroxytetrahydrobiopterin dehydratase [Paenibacillus sinopodophylli]